MTGRIDGISEVKHRTGKTEKGADFSFYQQTVSIAVGGEMIDLAYTSDNEPTAPFHDFQLDQVVRVKVGNVRVYKGKASYEAAK